MTGKKDILNDVLTGTDQDSFPGLEELNGLLTRPAPRPSRRKNPRNILKKNTSGRTKKKKATLYLSPVTYEGITSMLEEIRRIIPEGMPKRISKSQLVDTSMQLLLRDFEDRGKESLLVRHILETEITTESG